MGKTTGWCDGTLKYIDTDSHYTVGSWWRPPPRSIFPSDTKLGREMRPSNASPAAMQCSTSSPAAPLRAPPRVCAPGRAAWRQQPRQLGHHQHRLSPQAAVDCAPGEAARQDAPSEVPRMDARLDDELSMRAMELDPRGYFIIKVDRVSSQLVLEHYSNTINKNGGCACSCATGAVR